MNGTEMYTIFDLPIAVTNSIPADFSRPSCDSINNPIIDHETLAASANTFTRIAETSIETTGEGSGLGISTLGGTRPEARPQDGLGGAGFTDRRTSVHALWIGVFG